MTTPSWKSIIVQDDSTSCTQIKTLLQKHCPQVNVLAEATQVADAIHCIQKMTPNLVFCNVNLQDGNAFDMIDRMGGFSGHLIFTSSNDLLALRAFRYKAFDFLIKPIQEDQLVDVVKRLEKVELEKESAPPTLAPALPDHNAHPLILNAAGVQHVVQLHDIAHLQGDGNYSTVYLVSEEKILVSKPLIHFERMLPDTYFYRVHQSHIVNKLHVKSVQAGETPAIQLSTGMHVPLARRKKDGFLGWLGR